MDSTIGWLIVLISAAIYFAPSFVATHRDHAQVVPIFLVNLLLGWIVIGWIVALVWAFTAQRQPSGT